VKRWYAEIADLRAKDPLVVLMRDHAGEYKSEEIMEFLNPKGVLSCFSTKRTMAEWISRSNNQLNHDDCEPMLDS
jgi:hypothetical protein